jgi:hypothetical protein
MRFCEQVGIDEKFLVGEYQDEDVLPWDHVETHVPKAILLKAWHQYKRHVGMEPSRGEVIDNEDSMSCRVEEDALAAM